MAKTKICSTQHQPNKISRPKFGLCILTLASASTFWSQSWGRNYLRPKYWPHLASITKFWPRPQPRCKNFGIGLITRLRPRLSSFCLEAKCWPRLGLKVKRLASTSVSPSSRRGRAEAKVLATKQRPEGRGISLGQCYQAKPILRPSEAKTLVLKSDKAQKFGLKAKARRSRQRPMLRGRGQMRPRPNEAEVKSLGQGCGQNFSMEVRCHGNFDLQAKWQVCCFDWKLPFYQVKVQIWDKNNLCLLACPFGDWIAMVNWTALIKKISQRCKPHDQVLQTFANVCSNCLVFEWPTS